MEANMAAQKGDAILIKIGDGASPEVFTTVAGLRTKTLSFNRESVDVTNSDSSNKWRELLANAGVKSMSVSGDGVFTDATVDATLRTEFYGTTFSNYQITVPSFGTFTGAFDLTEMSYAGEHNGEATYSLTLESAAEPIFATV